jgi:hypothetical protein
MGGGDGPCSNPWRGGVNRLKKAVVRPKAKARSAPAKPAIPRGRGGGRKLRGGGV